MSLHEIIAKSNGAARKLAKSIDLSKPLVWDSLSCLEDFKALLANPPLHSVIIHFEPSVAAKIMEITNDKNRPLQKGYASRLGKDIAHEEYGLTGDTIKFSKTGHMLDGQHRLKGCADQAKPVISHVVFGLDDEVFDLIDQGKKRTPGDVLALCGVKNYTMVAGAVRWVKNLREMRRGDGGGNATGMSAREIKKAALGPMRDLSDWDNEAALINKAFKQPPTLVMAILFLIGKHNRLVAEDFAQSWINGARIGRNKNFDVLNQRIMMVRNQSGGTLNRHVNAAMVVQCFNHWNAGVIASPRSLTWRKEWTFPSLVFDKDVFLSARNREIATEDSLKALQARVLKTLDRIKDAHGNIQASYRTLSKESDVPERQMSYVLSTLRAENYIHLSKKGEPNVPAIWRLKTDGMARARSTLLKEAA